MKAVIMAGGKGSRLMPICERAPKPMTRLLDAPLLTHIIKLLKDGGFTELCMTLGHQPELIREYYGDGAALGVSITYSVEDSPLGTAGGVRACQDFIDGEDFLIISGDAACDFDLRELYRRHIETKSDVTLALHPQSEPLRYGTVVTDKQGTIISFIEKPSWSKVVTDLVNTGIYVISPHVMDIAPLGESFDFAKDLFPEAMRRGYRLTGHVPQGYWCDVGDAASYLRCGMDALDGKLSLTPGGDSHVFAGQGVFRLEKSVTVIAPSVISAGATLGEGAFIEHSVIHSGSVIGENSHIRNSVVDGGKTGPSCIMEGSILCRGAELAPRSVTGPGEVIARAGAASAPAASERDRDYSRRERGLCRELSCQGRAELMRRMSGALMEAGADFSDGIQLKDGKCRVRIYPLEEESAISIEATGGRETDRLEACRKYSALAEGFGGVAKI
jgi:mannose-1-phosphate guanylyltransferase/phosphomannomutase